MFFVILLFIVLPPIVFSVSLIALEYVEPDMRPKWRRRARASGILTLGSVCLLVFLVYALSHLD